MSSLIFLPFIMLPATATPIKHPLRRTLQRFVRYSAILVGGWLFVDFF